MRNPAAEMRAVTRRLPDNVETAESAVMELLDCTKPGEVISLIGPPAAGRRTLLRNLERAIRKQNRPQPLALDLPLADLDSGAQAWACLANSFPGLFPKTQAIQSRDRLQAELRRHLSEKFPEGGIALVYVPWLRPSDEDRPTQNRISEGILSVLQLLASRCALVLAAGCAWPMAPCIRLEKYRGTPDWIEQEFPDSIAELAEFQSEISCSRLELRLAYGLLQAGRACDEVRGLLRNQKPLESLAESLWDSLNEDCRPTTRDLWRFLAVSRGPIPTEWIDSVFGEGTSQSPFLRHALTYQEGAHLVLHERLRAPALRSMLHDEAGLQVWKDLHRHHAQGWECHRNQALERGDIASMIQGDVHYVFHSIESGADIPTLQDRIRFQDQLCLMGRTLSKYHRRFSEAYQCFRRAREIDGEDAYAWHYSSYNLAKTEGAKTQEVDEGYATAVQLHPSQLWYQLRWVRWLLSRGRRVEARAAWHQALQQSHHLSEVDDSSLHYYRNLHWLVAEMALQTGALDFAALTLRDIPEKMFSLDENLKGCRVKLEVLKLAEQGRLVRPLELALARGVAKLVANPELLPHRTQQGALCGWYAGRIEDIESDRLHLLLAIPPTPEIPEVRYQRTVMTRSTFDALTQDECFQELTPGRYVEIGEYGPQRQGLIRVFRLEM